MNKYAPEYMEIVRENLWDAVRVDRKKYAVIPAKRDVAINNNKAWENGETFAIMSNYTPYVEIRWNDRLGFGIAVVPESKQVINSINILGSMQGRSITSTNPEKALMFLNLLNTDEYLINLFIHGIEGIHYKRDEKGQVVKLPGGMDYVSEAYSIASLHCISIRGDTRGC